MDVDDECEIELEIDEPLAGKRLDVLLTDVLKSNTSIELDVVPTRSKIAAWIAEGLLTVNFQRVDKSSHRPKVGDVVRLIVPPVLPLHLEPDASLTLDVVYEDQDILVINKPADLVVHPGAGARNSTLVHGILAYMGGSFAVGEPFRPGVVHRLDKDTSGLMVVAKNDHAYQGIVQQFIPPRTIKRRYLALVAKAPSRESSGIIDLPIGRSDRDRKKMAVTAQGKPAMTEWSLLTQYSYGALLTLQLHTGRTHQIRVHLQAIGSPILGDPVYGEMGGNAPGRIRSAIKRLGRQALHAANLSFIHPRTGEEVAFSAPMPEDMRALAQVLTSNESESE